MTRTIVIAKEFSDVPAGRFRQDGPYTGQAFREDLLAPALRENDKVVVNLDGAEGYSSAFLEEAFGGLVRLNLSTATKLRQQLELIYHDKFVVDEIWNYIDTATATK